MEWNPKSLGQWDLEHLFFFNTKATENAKFQPFHWSGEADREINFSSGCSESELILASPSRSSKSASNNSSSNGDSKTSMFTLEGSQDGSTGKKEEPDETSPAATEPSLVSGEPLLTLKLGKRLYFESLSTGSDSKKPSSYEVPVSCGKKCKTSTQNMQKPSCQVEGCGLDLSSAKDYHRKHRVCESHSKSPKVVIAGLERRFCQQCSRFHALSEFDDKKRSCKRRLLDHNARRRKPQPEAVQFNQSALSSSLHDISIKNQRQRMSPFLFSRTATTDLAWQNMHNSKHPQTKDFLWKPEKAFNNMPSILTMLSDDSNGLLTSKGTATKSIVPGLEHPNATQDVNGALSLLSTNSSSWSNTYGNKPLSLQNSIRTHNMPQSLPLSSSQYWHTVQQPTNSIMCISSSYSDSDHSNRFQEFQLLNAPYESSGFPCNQLH